MAIDVNNIVPSAVPKTAGLPVVKIGDHYFPVGVVAGGGGNTEGSGNADVEYGVINSEGNFQPLELADVPPINGGDAVDAEIVMYDNGDYPDPVGTGQGKYRVRFFDYDGTVLKTVYTDGGEVTAPAVPDYERLLFQEWNNDFDNVTADLDVGAIYTTKSGKSEFDLDMNNLTGLTQYVGINLKSGTVTIEWGDGQSVTLSTIGETRASHTYAVGGKYTIMVSGTGEWELMTSALANPDGTGFTPNYAVAAVYLAGLGYLNSGLQMLPFCETATVDAAPRYHYIALFADSGIKHFNFPRNLKTTNDQLNAQMFNRCRALRSVVFAHETPLTHPRWLYFYGTALTDIVLPDTVEHIGDRDFFDTLLLKEIVIPRNVTTIDGGAFTNGHNPSFAGLKKVIMKPATPPTIALNVGNITQSSFHYNGSLKEIIVPAGCAEAYKNATNWSYYADIIKEEDI